MTEPSPLDRLKREPARFSLDQAAAIVAPGRDPTEIDFRTSPRLGAPGGEVSSALPEERQITSPTFGLIGAGGVLPRHYTALVAAEARRRSTALHRFLDLLARRFTGLFVKAGAKYRPARNPVPAETVLAAAAGLGTPHLVARLATPLPALLYHAGALASRSRSAERLRGLLAEEAGVPVRIVEFAGGWVRLPATEQSRLPRLGRLGGGGQLGVDAVAGAQIWDPSARFLVEFGPLNLAQFQALLPGSPLHGRLVELVRLQLGLEQDFAFNPILAAGAVPPLALGGEAGARLGWTSWMTSPHPRRRDAADAMLGPATPAPETESMSR
ncbi:type VI secretion system baseplate subunit TssG [Falsiroseomonas stagni]|uniref:Type VI secretion system protein ImpH n=1 Tax=Falsiroseomonas stagni DSM 19981 TaxID=1123062 RepID=A0A1I3ZNV9_9PROT|nr:type VI secretion system baseplate subunit TssG [Falsiroseomonas stagni]SFK45610.1 type VI secretion system protein ImpH [Falsiroseomonas stagni DSM 19981]